MHARKLRIVSAVAGLILAGGAIAAPAAIAQQPGPTASPITGMITLPTSLTLAIAPEMTSFNLTPASVVSATTPELVKGPGNTDGNAYIEVFSNDTAGYAVLENGPASFQNSGHTSSVPTSDVYSDQPNLMAGTYRYATLPDNVSAGLNVMSNTTVSGTSTCGSGGTSTCDWIGFGGNHDSIGFNGWALNTLPTVAGTFTGTIQMTLWGN